MTIAAAGITEAQDLPQESAEEATFRQQVRGWLAQQQLLVLGDSDGVGRGAEEHTVQSVAAAKDFQRRLADAGYAALSWPKECGGRGLSQRFELIYQQEASEYELPTALLNVGLGMCGPTILHHGTAEQKMRFLLPLIRAEETWCQLFSEPGAGSDLASVSSRATRVEGGWSITGQKVWTSGGRFSDFGLALLRCDPAAPKHKGMIVMIVDMRSPGVEVRPLRQMTGHAKFDEVFLDEVFVPDSHVIRGPGDGWTVALTTLLNERVSVAGNTALRGGSTSMLAVKARECGRTGEPGVRNRLVDAWIAETVLALLRERTKRAVTAGRTPGPEGSVGKLAASRFIQQASHLGLLLAGPGGAVWDPRQSGADQWALRLCAAPGLAIGGGTDEIVMNVIGERVLGLPREPVASRAAGTDKKDGTGR